MQTISVKCKLQVPIQLRQEIDVTLHGFADACNQIYEIAKRENCWNTTKLHHKVYKPVREATGLKANHVCQAIRRVIGNAKAVKQVHKFRPTSISLDLRTFQYIEESQTVGITLMSGRKKFKLSIGNYQLALLRGQSPSAATLNKTKRGDYYINICVDIPTDPIGKTPKVIGVDLGRRDIATTSTGKSWNGSQIQATRDRYSKVRANVQSKRTRSSRRLLRRLSGAEQRFQRWLNHNISKKLVQDAKRGNARLVFVPPAYTSQICARCHHVHPVKGKSYRSGKVFRCGHCSWTCDSNWNAALNIAALGLTYVNQPEVSGIACQLEGQLSLFPLGGESWDKAPPESRRQGGVVY